MPSRLYKAGLADPRTGPERIMGLLNRVASGNRNAPVRSWDDTPEERRKKKQLTTRGLIR